MSTTPHPHPTIRKRITMCCFRPCTFWRWETSSRLCARLWYFGLMCPRPVLVKDVALDLAQFGFHALPTVELAIR